MTQKQCFKCHQVKPLGDFYKHPQMADGHLNKCKQCNKKDVRENRVKKIDYYRAYDVERGNRQGYQYTQNYRLEFPKVFYCHSAVRNALRSKRMKKLPCEKCGSVNNIHAHHDDYDYPLNVRWLCSAHHREWHDKNGPGLNITDTKT